MKSIKKLIIVVGLATPFVAMGQSANQNYILTKTYTGANTSMDNIQYFDGLGRPVETVQKQFTPGGKDLVSRTEYDAFGRESKQWLPVTNAKSDGTFDDSTDGKTYYGDSYPYSETVYEPSPLNRVQDQYGPGANWRSGNGHKVTIEYMTNKKGDAILNCPIYLTNGGNDFNKSGDYESGQLYVTQTTDEDGNIAYEFKDKLGRVLLQRRISGNVKYDTNYVYDDFGNLCFILTPLASDALTANQSYNIWGTYNGFSVANNVYFYTYDSRNRRDASMITGTNFEPCVYDTADRLVMVQTAAYEIPVPGSRGWLFYKYDAFGRVILSGIYHGDDNNTVWNENDRVYYMRLKFQTILSKESPSSNANDFFYTWNTFPALNQSEVTQVNFYDNYTYATDNAGNNPGSLVYQQPKTGYGMQYSSAQGLLTGTWDKLSDGSGWIKTTYYYDVYGNLVQKRSTNNRGGYDYEYYAYNYNNMRTKKYIEHVLLGQPMITEEYAYNYDVHLRLTSVNYKFNGGTGVDIAAYQYDDLGRMREKKIGGGKETVAFKYNVRSWETEQAGQRFSENLYYESNHPANGTVYYNGNVSAMKWKTEPSSNSFRGYSFNYNTLGWLTNAMYGEMTGTTGSITGLNRYDESFTYDKNGNIKSLKRYGMKDNNTFGLIDDLDVTESSGNFIRKITDYAGNQSSSDIMEFKYNSEPLNDNHYFYNGTGALMVDYHKRICMMKYNYLTMPQSVQFRNGDRIEYVYDAAGVKRQETHKVANRDLNYGYWDERVPASSDFNSSLAVTTFYFGNKVYVNGQLKYILTDEGYIEKTGNAYNAFYYLNDHLGNHRIVMDANGNIKQMNNFYPSGTSMAERRTDQGVQPYKFGGKELDRTDNLDFYDFEARSFDPVLMRFTRPDPMAGKYPGISVYAYCGNNPVNYIDRTGCDTIYANLKGDIYGTLPGGEDIVVVGESLPEVTVTGQKPKSDATKVMEGTLAISGALVADDAVGGEADDVLIPFILVGGAIVTDAMFLYEEFNSPSPPTITTPETYDSPKETPHYKDDAQKGGKQGKGERGRTKSADGTDNPSKHRKPDPNKPGNILEQDPHTGKWKSKPQKQ